MNGGKMSRDYNGLLVDEIEKDVEKNWSNIDELKKIKIALQSRKTKRSKNCYQKVEKRIKELSKKYSGSNNDDNSSSEKILKLIRENEKIKKKYSELEMKFNKLQMRYDILLKENINLNSHGDFNDSQSINLNLFKSCSEITKSKIKKSLQKIEAKKKVIGKNDKKEVKKKPLTNKKK